MISTQTLAGELKALLGEDRVLTEPEQLTQRAVDTWPLRLVQQVAGAQPVLPRLVLRPRSTAEVARALAYLSERGVPVVPYGGGSGVTGGAVPTAESVVLDLGAMNQILSLDADNMTVTVQPGVLLADLERWVNERGFITGHYPQSIDVAQVGGLVATFSAGQFSTKYGNIEDMLAGLEAVLPSGEVVRVHCVPRRAVGPDLRHLWIGSEGTLGVITEVTLKLFPKPAERWMQAYAVPSMRQGLAIIQRFMQAGWKPAVVRLIDFIEAARLLQDTMPGEEALLILLSEGPSGCPAVEGAALDAIVRDGGGRPMGERPVELWLERRNDVHEFDQYINMGIIVDTIEVAAPWTRIADIYEQVTTRVRAEVPELVIIMGHSSHSYIQGTNLYFIFGAQPPRDPAEVERVYWSVWERVMAITRECGGTICHHHGIGKLRARWVPEELGSAWPLLRRLKQALDPGGVMNPGTLLPPE
ncbi:alkyldihydroxyacetonephosphate synthase [Symbiobacterium terraclitae]|uniref:Alkyldihydroxyacetonephosphate synthase n=1 Tax=Symbiobacterium terraclitae TaxID=557451 RepID=A0ABS4JSG9_9FIRM|nr:FAD-binding oxidoreductase [Symbiobacterium terraclitae]MBP2018472.1 alkyldihydroxyacetonephosphate synthase [Symbiobacterium terraclitae]